MSREMGRIVTLTLNRPERLNAVNGDFHAELVDVFVDLGNDYETDVIILTGAGKAFCAGGDVKDMLSEKEPFGGGRDIDPLVVMGAEARRLCRNMLDVEQPIIAAVNGDAFGLGASMALCCDIVVVAEDASLGGHACHRRLGGGDGGAVMWPLLVGPLRAKEFLMRGSRISGRDAASMGMVNYALPRDEVLPKAQALAAELAAGAPLAIRWTKYAVNKWLKDVYERCFDVSIAHEMLTMRSSDHKEGLAALLERRPPRFTGH